MQDTTNQHITNSDFVHRNSSHIKKMSQIFRPFLPGMRSTQTLTWWGAATDNVSPNLKESVSDVDG
jgi:hypothetical protein